MRPQKFTLQRQSLQDKNKEYGPKSLHYVIQASKTELKYLGLQCSKWLIYKKYIKKKEEVSLGVVWEMQAAGKVNSFIEEFKQRLVDCRLCYSGLACCFRFIT